MSAIVTDLSGKNQLKVRIVVEQAVYSASGKLHDEKVMRRAPDVEIDQCIFFLGCSGTARRTGAFKRDVRGILLYCTVEQRFLKRTCISGAGTGGGHLWMLR